VRGMELDDNQCWSAVKARDARFDGRFFTGVKTTGIFCRPVCPAPHPKRENVGFHKSAAAAFAAGFRPCLRCRPELAPSAFAWLNGEKLVAQAMDIIQSRLGDPPTVEALAAQIGVTDRHLRRLFDTHMGATPMEVIAVQRLLFAKQLLAQTTLPLTDVALAAGYGSVRRFNDAVRQAWQRTPSDLRKLEPPANPRAALSVRLPLKSEQGDANEWTRLVQYYRLRALPGIESVDDTGFARSFMSHGHTGWFEVSPEPQGLAVTRIAQHLAQDPLIAPLVAAHGVPRLAVAWDPFEITVRAILGQQVSVKGATTLAGRIIAKFGEPAATGHANITRHFPTPQVLADADLGGLGLVGARINAIRTLARTMADDAAFFTRLTSPEQAEAALTALPGIGPWTAQYAAMRALGLPDCFPTHDLGLVRVAQKLGFTGNAKAIDVYAQRWAPWRSYAALVLWMSES
jgi:AraC family transcriptional regulator, regulatory protein of adaptative response / DNA-3-methyladenine glycosylase II